MTLLGRCVQRQMFHKAFQEIRVLVPRSRPTLRQWVFLGTWQGSLFWYASATRTKTGIVCEDVRTSRHAWLWSSKTRRCSFDSRPCRQLWGKGYKSWRNELSLKMYPQCWSWLVCVMLKKAWVSAECNSTLQVAMSMNWCQWEAWAGEEREPNRVGKKILDPSFDAVTR